MSSFNPRTPAGCDCIDGCHGYFVIDVSIHAPLRGATLTPVLPRLFVRVSIHAPLRGATKLPEPEVLRQNVSIHAPLRGATFASLNISSACRSFNPRTPAGCDSGRICQVLNGQAFQSTHPCGVRPWRSSKWMSWLVFQSTHPCGVRPNSFPVMLYGH